MSYKEELKKQIKALKEFEELRKADPSKALKFDNLLKIRQIGAQTWKFFLSLNNSPKLFGGKDAYDAFIARNHDLLKGNRIEKSLLVDMVRLKFLISTLMNSSK